MSKKLKGLPSVFWAKVSLYMSSMNTIGQTAEIWVQGWLQNSMQKAPLAKRGCKCVTRGLLSSKWIKSCISILNNSRHTFVSILTQKHKTHEKMSTNCLSVHFLNLLHPFWVHRVARAYAILCWAKVRSISSPSARFNHQIFSGLEESLRSNRMFDLLSSKQKIFIRWHNSCHKLWRLNRCTAAAF